MQYLIEEAFATALELSEAHAGPAVDESPARDVESELRRRHQQLLQQAGL